MIDFVIFIFSQIGNLFNFLDSFVLFENITLLKILIIICIFRIILKFLGGKDINE